MKVYLTEFHYKKKYNLFDYLLCGVLFVPSLGYLGITKFRNFLYRKDLIKSYKSFLYTISVGNLTTGGTGKTPITAEIANYLSSKGQLPAILSRGYGGRLKNKEVNVISDGNNIYYDSIDAGDEPFWLAQNCKGSAVLTCSSRVKSAIYAKDELKCSKLILDDGFQHLKIKRDLNILVVDSEKQFSNGMVLPLGALRESLKEIKRADKIVVVNKRFDDLRAKAYARFLRKTYKKPVFLCNMVPDKIYNIKTKEELVGNEPMMAFSAIGQPEQFYGFLRHYDVMGTKSFPDHHIYTEKDLLELESLKEKYAASIMITTEKDAVKILELESVPENIYALKLKPLLDIEGLLNG